jgi:basic membrane protein A and related proteins
VTDVTKCLLTRSQIGDSCLNKYAECALKSTQRTLSIDIANVAVLLREEPSVLKGVKLASVLAVASLALAACGSSGETAESAAPAETAATSSVKVGMAYDQDGKGDGSFNDAAFAGLSKAQTDLGVEIKEVNSGSSATDATREELLTLLADGGYNPVIAVGFAYSTALAAVAPKFPETTFAIVDSVVESPNVGSLIFAAEQGSYLTGVIAATASQSGTIGFIGGMEIDLIKAFEAGYIEGAQSVNPDIKIESKYMGAAGDNTAWNVPEKAKTATDGMIANGADVIYAAAGGSGLGMFQSVKAAADGGATVWAIGVDSDQYTVPALAEYKDIIVTSMLKRVDVAVYDVIAAVVDGAPLVGVQNFDLSKDGVGYSTSNSAVSAFTDAADAAAEKIKSGEVVVGTTVK